MIKCSRLGSPQFAAGFSRSTPWQTLDRDGQSERMRSRKVVPSGNDLERGKSGAMARSTSAKNRRRRTRECGLVAVEFVVMFPILFLMLMGIIQFGRYYNATIAVTHAARESVRSVALGGNAAGAQSAATTAAPGLTVVAGSVTTCPSSGVGNASVTVTNSFSLTDNLGFGLGPFTISRTGLMRCGG